MEKQNLVISHSFPTNSILLEGLIDFLNDYFNVYFIDLPGFTKKVPPLSEMSFEGYSRYVENQIDEFALDSFLVGGISFSFLVMNNIKFDQKCKGIIAIEPFLGPKSLRMSPRKKAFYSSIVRFVCYLKLYKPVWGSNLVKTYLPKMRNYPSGTIDIMLDQVDAWTFFETGKLLLGDEHEFYFHNLPYVLVANPDDRSVNYDYIHSTMMNNIEELLVLNTTLDHYPKNTSKEYFMEQIPEEIIEKISKYFSNQS